MIEFKKKLATFAARAEQLKDQIQTEEATKTALIMPFFSSVLGYDVFNPAEFVPEYVADVGIKKGEKVDYAIFINGELSILLEAKSVSEKLDRHDSQLFRYYAASSVRFAILTNGLDYRFYADLETPNKMDDRPFLEFNILDIKDNIIPEIRKFERDKFDCSSNINSASELKYAQEIKKLLANELANPSDDFIRFMLKDIYSGVKTQTVIDRFRDTVRRSFNQFINDILSDKLNAVMGTGTNDDDVAAVVEHEVEAPPEDKIVTTQEEIECYAMIKTMLKDSVDVSRIGYRDTENYFNILLDNNGRKWICRIAFGKTQISLYIPDENKKSIRYTLDNIDAILNYKKELAEVVTRYVDPVQPSANVPSTDEN